MHEKGEMLEPRPDLGAVKFGCPNDASRHQNQTKRTGKATFSIPYLLP